MFIEKGSKIEPLLADMHFDGVRFDPKILEALRQQTAKSVEKNG
ncbi:MAG: hypothetical protein AAF348_01975 [Bacteroidota bacterium]